MGLSLLVFAHVSKCLWVMVDGGGAPANLPSSTKAQYGRIFVKGSRIITPYASNGKTAEATENPIIKNHDQAFRDSACSGPRSAKSATLRGPDSAYIRTQQRLPRGWQGLAIGSLASKPHAAHALRLKAADQPPFQGSNKAGLLWLFHL
ncbi:hypothetical protein V2G26_015106 [Clonostachys chloroleuca]